MKLHHALALAERGLRIFPLVPNTKVPAIDGWKEKATTDPFDIMDWWGDGPERNIGVAGTEHLAILDFDAKNGKQGLATFLAMHAEGLPDSFTVETPTGGVHVYVAADRAFPNSVDRIEGYPDLDIRSKGGYVVGPGSTIDGKMYESLGDLPIADLPQHFITALENAKAKSDKTEHPVTELDQQKNVDRATKWLIDTAPSAVEGQGGDQNTYAVAARMRDFALSEQTALDLLLAHWNEAKASPPWTPDELQQKVQNAFSYATGAWGALTPEGDFGTPDALDLGHSPFEDFEPHTEDRANGTVGSTDTKKSPFHLLSYDEMANLPTPEWLVENIVQRKSAALMFGKSNAFKSFLAIDIGCAIAAGTSWHGNKVKQGKVLYVATEGANGVGRLRIPTWFEHHNTPAHHRANMFLFPKEIRLDEKAEMLGLARAIRAIGGFELVVLDIFGGTMSGPETEDTTARAWVHNLQAFMRNCGCATLTVAHTGWQDETRARMHTHFWGSFDSRMKAEGDKEKLQTVLIIERHKDADSTGQWGFSLKKAPCPAVEGGTSLVLERDDSAVKQAAIGRWPDAAVKVFGALEALVLEKGALEMSLGAVCVEETELRSVCLETVFGGSDKADSRSKSFRRAKDWLLQNGHAVAAHGKIGVK